MMCSERQQRNHDGPSWNAGEHQNRPQQLKPADRFKPWRCQEFEILHIALTPADIAADELERVRRIVFIRPAFDRHDANFVASAPHQRRFDLIMGKDRPPERRAAHQHRQVASLVERLNPHNRVMPPIRPAVGRPPGLPHGVGAHAKPHAKLKDPRKCRMRGRSDDQALENANLRIGLHDADEIDDGLARHQAVGVKRQH